MLNHVKSQPKQFIYSRSLRGTFPLKLRKLINWIICWNKSQLNLRIHPQDLHKFCVNLSPKAQMRTKIPLMKLEKEEFISNRFSDKEFLVVNNISLNCNLRKKFLTYFLNKEIYHSTLILSILKDILFQIVQFYPIQRQCSFSSSKGLLFEW